MQYNNECFTKIKKTFLHRNAQIYNLFHRSLNNCMNKSVELKVVHNPMKIQDKALKSMSFNDKIPSLSTLCTFFKCLVEEDLSSIKDGDLVLLHINHTVFVKHKLKFIQFSLEVKSDEEAKI